MLVLQIGAVLRHGAELGDNRRELAHCAGAGDDLSTLQDDSIGWSLCNCLTGRTCSHGEEVCGLANLN